MALIATAFKKELIDPMNLYVQLINTFVCKSQVDSIVIVEL